MGVYREDPFRTPAAEREPSRRFRGRLTSGVTIWTSNGPEGPTGLTVSSLLLAEGEPSRILGLINDTTDLFEAIRSSGRFVVHVVDAEHQRWADILAGLYPMPGGIFSALKWAETGYGPAISDLPNRAMVELEDITDAGYQQLVRGKVGRFELADLSEPLVYFRGRYRRLQDPT